MALAAKPGLLKSTAILISLFAILKKIKQSVMKFVLLLIVLFSAGGCVALQREVEVELGHAELIRIDTLYRYPEHIKQLTWKDEKNTRYISIASMGEVYKVGTKMRMLHQR
jgi:hypothetical protein